MSPRGAPLRQDRVAALEESLQAPEQLELPSDGAAHPRRLIILTTNKGDFDV